MRNTTKNWLLASSALIALGGIIFTATACAVKWDFTKFSTVVLETNTYTLNEAFNDISVDIHTAGVTFLSSENDECKVVCHEDVKEKATVAITDGTLTIQSSDERAWYDYLTVTGSGSPTITVYLPQTQYSNLTIKTHTGDIKIPRGFTFDNINLSGSTCDIECYANVTNSLTVEISTGDINLKDVHAGSVSLTSSTGDIEVISTTIENDLYLKVSSGESELTDITCRNFTSLGSTGDLEMKDFIASGKMSIERNTGDVELNNCDATEIYIKTTTGDVRGSLRTTKDFHADSTSGDVKVPSSSVGGKCEITCSTGDIRISVLESTNE